MGCGLDEAELSEQNVSSLTHTVKIFSEESGNAILTNIFSVLQQLAHRILHVREDMSLSQVLGPRQGKAFGAQHLPSARCSFPASVRLQDASRRRGVGKGS